MTSEDIDSSINFLSKIVTYELMNITSTKLLSRNFVSLLQPIMYILLDLKLDIARHIFVIVTDFTHNEKSKDLLLFANLFYLCNCNELATCDYQPTGLPPTNANHFEYVMSLYGQFLGRVILKIRYLVCPMYVNQGSCVSMLAKFGYIIQNGDYLICLHNVPASMASKLSLNGLQSDWC